MITNVYFSKLPDQSRTPKEDEHLTTVAHSSVKVEKSQDILWKERGKN